MNVWGYILRTIGWKVKVNIPLLDKCVICVAPHTSNNDFLLGLFAYKSLGRNANFLMKKFWFFFPLNILLKKLGGIPVDRSKKTSLIEKIIDLFNTRSYLNLALTPEGTRKKEEEWHKGFLYISYGAKVPILLSVIDYKNKEVIIDKEFIPTGDVTNDMTEVREYYDLWQSAAKYPHKFSKLNE